MTLTRAALIDLLHCPVCGAVLSGPRCGTCGAELAGLDGTRLIQLSRQIAGLLDQRDVVLGRIRAASVPAAAPASPLGPGSSPVPASSPVPVPGSVPAAPQVAVPGSGAASPAFTGPVAAPDWFSRLGVHGVLLGVGALLLAVASIGFLAYSWQLLALPARATIIAVVTAGVLWGAGRLKGSLPDAAEAIGALGVVLVLADAWAVRSTGLANADQAPAAAYAAGSAAVCGVLLGAWFTVFRVRAWSIGVAVLAPLALVLAGAQFDPPALASQGLTLGLLAAAGLALVRNLLPGDLVLERRILRIGSAAALGLAVLVALLVAGDGGYGWAAAVLALAGLVTGSQAAADSGLVRTRWSAAAGVVLAVAAAEGGQAVARALALIPDAWLDRPGGPVASLSPWVLLPMLFPAVLVVVVSVPVVRGTLRRNTRVRPGAVIGGAASIAGLLAIPVAIQAVAGVAVTIAAAAAPAWRPGAGTAITAASLGTPISSARGWLVTVAGLVLFAAWTFASRWLGAPGRIRGGLRRGALAAAGLAAAVLALAPWLPLWAQMLVLLVVVATTAVRPVDVAARVRPPVRKPVGPPPDGHTDHLLAMVAAGTLVPLTGVLAVQLVWLLDAGVASCFVLAGVVAVSGVLISVLGLVLPVPEARRRAAEAGLVLTGIAALVVTGQPAPGTGVADLDGRLWPVLLLLGAGAAAIATAADRLPVRWLAGLLLAGSSWARLATSGVTLVEAYTLPPAAVLLALSLWHIRRTPSSAPRLLVQVATLALAPSILVSWSGTGLRPALLLVVAGALAGVSGMAGRDAGGVSRALAGVAALVAASTALVRVLGAVVDLHVVSVVPLGSVEAWTLPAAALLLLVGLRFDLLPGASAGHELPPSWSRTGPGLAFLLLPSLFVLIGDGAQEAGPVRIALLTVLAGATLCLGAVRRMQAPVLAGAGVLVIDALAHLLPWIVAADVPPWVLLAVLGLLLVVLGATYEKRLRQVRDLRLLISALH